jgi:hypothetical protein
MSKYILRIEKGKDFDGEMEKWTPQGEAIESNGYVLISFDGKSVTTAIQGTSLSDLKDWMRQNDMTSMMIRAAAVLAEAEIKAQQMYKAARNEEVKARMRRILTEED